MSTLKTHNLQSPDAGSVNIAMAPNAGMVVTGISTFIATVKIGSSVPDAESGSDDLIVGNTSGEHGITIFSGTTSAGTIFFGDGTGVNNRRGAIRYLQADDAFQFNTNGNSEKVRIKSNGFFGIGTTNPSAKLTVSDTGPAIVDIHHSDGGNGDESRIILGALALNPPSNRGAGIAAVNTGNGHDLSIKTSNTHGLGPSEKLRVKNSGSVGIGTTNPTAKLEVKGSNNPLVKIVQDTSGIARLNIESATNDGYQYSGIGLGDGTNDAELMWTTAGFDINVGNAVRLRITSGGQIQLPVNGQQLTWGASQQFKMYWENSEDRMYLLGDGAYGMAFRINGGNRLEINKTTGDVTMQGSSGRNFNWDNSEASLYLTDNGSGSSARLKIGSGQDLQLYHDTGGANHITCATNRELKVSANKHTFYDYTGVTKRMEIDASGQVTKPLTPGFFQRNMNGADYNNGQLKGGNNQYNTGNHYNTSTAIFTAPVAGRYAVGCGVLVQTGSGRLEGNIKLNNTTRLATFNGTGTTYDGPNVHFIVNLSANDNLRVIRQMGTAYPYTHDNHYFYAYLVG